MHLLYLYLLDNSILCMLLMACLIFSSQKEEQEMGFFDNIKAKLNALKSHSYHIRKCLVVGLLLCSLLDENIFNSFVINSKFVEKLLNYRERESGCIRIYYFLISFYLLLQISNNCKTWKYNLKNFPPNKTKIENILGFSRLTLSEIKHWMSVPNPGSEMVKY